MFHRISSLQVFSLQRQKQNNPWKSSCPESTGKIQDSISFHCTPRIVLSPKLPHNYYIGSCELLPALQSGRGCVWEQCDGRLCVGRSHCPWLLPPSTQTTASQDSTLVSELNSPVGKAEKPWKPCFSLLCLRNKESLEEGMTGEQETLVTSKASSRTPGHQILPVGLPLFTPSSYAPVPLHSLESSASALRAPHLTPQTFLFTCSSLCRKTVSVRATFFVLRVK